MRSVTLCILPSPEFLAYIRTLHRHVSSLLLPNSNSQVSRSSVSIEHSISIMNRPSIFKPCDFAGPDIQFDVTRRFLADEDSTKINLGQGTYRDGDGKPWVLPSIKMAKESLGEFNHEYLPITGYKPFLQEATKLLFHGTTALAEDRARPPPPPLLPPPTSSHLHPISPPSWVLVNTSIIGCFMPVAFRDWCSTSTWSYPATIDQGAGYHLRDRSYMG